MMGGFHGMTLAPWPSPPTLLPGRGRGAPLQRHPHPRAYMFPELDTIHYMETLLTDDHSGVEKPAAIVLETVQADGGINPFPVEWLQRSAPCATSTTS